MVVGTSLGTVTDVNGRYSIAMPRGKNQLKFAYVGYLTQTLSVNNSTLNVRMKEDNAALQEVVVVGYGISKPGKVRASSKKQEDAAMALEGKVSGITVSKEMPESELIAVNEQKAQFGYEFDIRQPLTLSADGKTTTTEIARYQLPATYQYLGIPRADKDAFLVADATGWQTLNLMEGEANVYFDNAFVGKSILDPTIASDTLHFSLGRDQGIRLQRTKVNESSTRRFLGSNQEQTVTWRITARNSRQEAVNLTIFDQTPISRNSSIDVTVEELSGGKRDADTGIVTWPLQLQPGEQRDIILQYKIKYPKSRRLSIE